jgi:hypothetical protein
MPIGMIILKFTILKTGYKGVGWICLGAEAGYREHGTLMKLQVALKAGRFMTIKQMLMAIQICSLNAKWCNTSQLFSLA